MKADFELKSDYDDIINNGGISVNNLFLPAEEYKSHKFPIRCKKCLKFGHIEKICNSKLTCSKCSLEHNSTSCTELNYKCINCNQNHSSTSRNCPIFIFIHHFSKLNNLNID